MDVAGEDPEISAWTPLLAFQLPGGTCVSKHRSMSAALASVHVERDVCGVPTEVLIQTFADRILVLVTQLGKVGSLVRVPPKRSQFPCLNLILPSGSSYDVFGCAHDPSFASTCRFCR